MSGSSQTVALWYVTLHGGSNDIGDNIRSYDSAGNLVSDAVLDTSQVHLQELRGFVVLPGDNLYIANAYKGNSAILHFGPAQDTRTPRKYLGTFVSATTSPGLRHPFTVIEGSDGNIYVSNQDTNIVTRYYGPLSAHSAGTVMPLPLPLTNYPAGTLYPGTFIPPANVVSDGVKMIRDILFGPDGFWYVADEAYNEVRQYDGSSGIYHHSIVRQSDGLQAPVHLLLSPDQKYLYIGSSQNDKVLRYHFHSGKVETFVHSGDGGLKATAGMAFSNDGWFYVVSRQTNQILRYRQSDGTPDHKPFIDIAGQSKSRVYNPEFIALVTVPVSQKE